MPSSTIDHAGQVALASDSDALPPILRLPQELLLMILEEIPRPPQRTLPDLPCSRVRTITIDDGREHQVEIAALSLVCKAFVCIVRILLLRRPLFRYDYNKRPSLLKALASAQNDRPVRQLFVYGLPVGTGNIQQKRISTLDQMLDVTWLRTLSVEIDMGQRVRGRPGQVSVVEVCQSLRDAGPRVQNLESISLINFAAGFSTLPSVLQFLIDSLSLVDLRLHLSNLHETLQEIQNAVEVGSRPWPTVRPNRLRKVDIRTGYTSALQAITHLLPSSVECLLLASEHLPLDRSDPISVDWSNLPSLVHLVWYTNMPTSFPRTIYTLHIGACIPSVTQLNLPLLKAAHVPIDARRQFLHAIDAGTLPQLEFIGIPMGDIKAIQDSPRLRVGREADLQLGFFNVNGQRIEIKSVAFTRQQWITVSVGLLREWLQQCSQ